jgi:hypothetical protein
MFQSDQIISNALKSISDIDNTKRYGAAAEGAAAEGAAAEGAAAEGAVAEGAVAEGDTIKQSVNKVPSKVTQTQIIELKKLKENGWIKLDNLVNMFFEKSDVILKFITEPNLQKLQTKCDTIAKYISENEIKEFHLNDLYGVTVLAVVYKLKETYDFGGMLEIVVHSNNINDWLKEFFEKNVTDTYGGIKITVHEKSIVDYIEDKFKDDMPMSNDFLKDTLIYFNNFDHTQIKYLLNFTIKLYEFNIKFVYFVSSTSSLILKVFKSALVVTSLYQIRTGDSDTKLLSIFEKGLACTFGSDRSKTENVIRSMTIPDFEANQNKSVTRSKDDQDWLCDNNINAACDDPSNMCFCSNGKVCYESECIDGYSYNDLITTYLYDRIENLAKVNKFTHERGELLVKQASLLATGNDERYQLNLTCDKTNDIYHKQYTIVFGQMQMGKTEFLIALAIKYLLCGISTLIIVNASNADKEQLKQRLKSTWYDILEKMEATQLETQLPLVLTKFDSRVLVFDLSNKSNAFSFTPANPQIIVAIAHKDSLQMISTLLDEGNKDETNDINKSENLVVIIDESDEIAIGTKLIQKADIIPFGSPGESDNESDSESDSESDNESIVSTSNSSISGSLAGSVNSSVSVSPVNSPGGSPLTTPRSFVGTSVSPLNSPSASPPNSPTAIRFPVTTVLNNRNALLESITGFDFSANDYKSFINKLKVYGVFSVTATPMSVIMMSNIPAINILQLKPPESYISLNDINISNSLLDTDIYKRSYGMDEDEDAERSVYVAGQLTNTWDLNDTGDTPGRETAHLILEDICNSGWHTFYEKAVNDTKDYSSKYVIGYKKIEIPRICLINASVFRDEQDNMFYYYMGRLSELKNPPIIIEWHGKALKIYAGGIVVGSDTTLKNDFNEIKRDKNTYYNKVTNLDNVSVDSIFTYIKSLGLDIVDHNIIFISGTYSKRGISFAGGNSNDGVFDTRWHLTDMFYLPSNTDTDGTILQAIGRICGKIPHWSIFKGGGEKFNIHTTNGVYVRIMESIKFMNEFGNKVKENMLLTLQNMPQNEELDKLQAAVSIGGPYNKTQIKILREELGSCVSNIIDFESVKERINLTSIGTKKPCQLQNTNSTLEAIKSIKNNV